MTSEQAPSTIDCSQVPGWLAWLRRVRRGTIRLADSASVWLLIVAGLPLLYLGAIRFAPSRYVQDIGSAAGLAASVLVLVAAVLAFVGLWHLGDPIPQGVPWFVRARFVRPILILCVAATAVAIVAMLVGSTLVEMCILFASACWINLVVYASQVLRKVAVLSGRTRLARTTRILQLTWVVSVGLGFSAQIYSEWRMESKGAALVKASNAAEEARMTHQRALFEIASKEQEALAIEEELAGR